jgi:hypothetical protein
MATALSLLMLTVVALIGGAIYLWRKPGSRRQAWLMLVLATVFAVNIAIWSWPGPDGRSPLAQASEVAGD